MSEAKGWKFSRLGQLHQFGPNKAPAVLVDPQLCWSRPVLQHWGGCDALAAAAAQAIKRELVLYYRGPMFRVLL